MARTQRLRRSPPINPPSTSLRFLTLATIGFLSFICVILIWSSFHEENSAKKRMTSTTQKNRFDAPQQIPPEIIANLDAIVVLGGGVPISVDEPPLYTQRRCDDAAQVVKLYKEKSPKKKTLPILCLSAGTAHLPQLLSPDGLPVWEATSSAAYLLKQYADILDKSQVYVETTSYDTIGNAFFARTSFTDISGWRKLLIITNEFHMDRSRAIFDWIFGLDKSNYQLYYLASPNVGLTDTAVQARKEREAKSQHNVENVLSKKYIDMKGVWTFLTQEHALYTAHKLVERGKAGGSTPDDQALKESYGLSKRTSDSF